MGRRGGRHAAWRRHRARLAILVVLAALVVVLVTVQRTAVDRDAAGNLELRVDDPAEVTAPWPARGAPRTPERADEPPYVTSVGPGGRYLVDQFRQPILVRGDTPWSMMTDLSPAQARRYLDDRAEHGVNAIATSLVGALGNGGPHDDGATYDGIQPFRGNDITRWNPRYLDRVRSYLRMAADRGITVMLYALDAWTLGHSVDPGTVGRCAAYGRTVARQLADLPNIVWMAGGDYLPQAAYAGGASTVDLCLNQLVRGIRSTGDSRLFSIQLGFGLPTATSDYPYWASRADWNFVYTYQPTYRAVLDGYQRTGGRDPRPALLSEANYEGENNQYGTPPTTDQTLRRQVLWTATSGGAGDFYGSDDWEFLPGWADRLDSSGFRQVSRLRALLAGLEWWTWRPDLAHRFLVDGVGRDADERDPVGDVLSSDVATAALAPDGRSGLVYLPTPRAITIDPDRLAPGVTASWVDPTTGTAHPAGRRRTYPAQPANAEGDGDWLLLFGPS